MKKQICFAGFGEGEVEALQPSLAALSGAWDCVFCPDAASALQALAAGPFDAAVANLSPGGIHDAELLQQSAISYPHTMRFVLGDVADRELVVNCMGAAHQFISRPWKPRELVSIIERSLALDAWLSSDRLRSFIPRLGKLPGLPATYFEVLKRAESPNSSIESVSEVIARDPALTARLLQMVNSPACGLKEKITHPNEAVSRLGLDTVKSLVLCLQLFAESNAAEGSISLDLLWQHSFTVAKLSNNIVVHCISSERMGSDAYTAGLLHNIGQIVLATNLAKEYTAVVQSARKRKCPLQEVEEQLLGVTSTQVGAYLLGLWGMPLPLVEAVALHHAPGTAKVAEFTLLTVVHVANVLACEEKGKNNGLVPPKLDVAYLDTLGLPNKTDAWRKLLATKPSNGSGQEKPTPARAGTSSTEIRRRRAAAAATANGQGGGWLKKLLAVGAVAAVIVAGVALKWHPGRAIRTLTSPDASQASTAQAGTQAPAPATGPGNATAPAAPLGSPFDSIKVQSILYNRGHPVALINGQACQIGDKLTDVEVVSISRTNVVLACKGATKTFTIQ